MTAVSNEDLLKIYEDTRTIAVVGASSDETKPANRIPRYLQSQGFRIVPVNPTADELFGERVYRSLSDIDADVDVVDVFRPPSETPAIAREAIATGAKVLWLQLGIASDEAETIATEAGMTVVMDRCMGATHRQLGLEKPV